MPVRRSLGSVLVALTALTGGCGLPEHFALVRDFRTPPALSPVAVGVQPFASVEAGISTLTRTAIQDALFAAQAGNRERALLALQSAQATLANGPATGPVTASSIGDLVHDIEASQVSAQAVAERLQAALPGLGLAAPPTP